MWAFTQDYIGDVFWTEILPRLKALESQTWSDILVRDKKQNHSLDLDDLNKVAPMMLLQSVLTRKTRGVSAISSMINSEKCLPGLPAGFIHLSHFSMR